MAEQKETPKEKSIREQALSQLVTLLTASFGLVAALAWNQVAQEFVTDYIQPYFGKNSGLTGALVYAIAVTIFAVIVTYFMARFLKKN